jgi:hypothetical protein
MKGLKSFADARQKGGPPPDETPSEKFVVDSRLYVYLTPEPAGYPHSSRQAFAQPYQTGAAPVGVAPLSSSVVYCGAEAAAKCANGCSGPLSG